MPGTVEDLLREAEIAQFLTTHQGSTADRVRRAAELLLNENDAFTALKKLLRPLEEQVINVFFSYKKKDEDAAKKIMEVLAIHSAEKLNIASMANFGVEIAGRPWRQAIRNEIEKANWFILLLPDPSDDWDWCLYEAGLFDAHGTSADRLICIHHPDVKVPTQIDGYQAVPAVIPEVEEFLKMVYLGENAIPGMRPLNRAVEPELPELAKEIVLAIRPPQQQIFRQAFPAWVELRVDPAFELKDENSLDNASVLACNNEALQVFSSINIPRSWGTLRTRVQEGDSRWRAELCRALKAIIDGEMFEPVQAVFKSKNGRIYRPVACAADRVGGEDGSIDRFHVAFVEEIGAIDHSSLPEQMAILSSTLRFSFRFRWEVLEPFSKPGMTADDVVKLEGTLLRMRADWYSRGINDFGAVLRCFSEEKASRISAMMLQWQSVRNIDGTGLLDIAIKNKDVAAIPTLLREFIPVSQEFLEIAADRFSDMVAGR